MRVTEEMYAGSKGPDEAALKRLLAGSDLLSREEVGLARRWRRAFAGRSRR